MTSAEIRDLEELEIVCARCGAWAMRIRTTAPGDPLEMPHDRPAGDPGMRADADGVRTETAGAGTWLAASLMNGGIEAIRMAMRAGDVDALYRLHPEIAPLYCPACGASYCVDEWRLRDEFDPDDPGWYDETRGVCPDGHERRVYD